MILQFLEDTFKNMRCYSRCCEYNECSCSNVEPQAEEHHHETIEHHQSEAHRHHEPPEPPEIPEPPEPPEPPDLPTRFTGITGNTHWNDIVFVMIQIVINPVGS